VAVEARLESPERNGSEAARSRCSSRA
jgi:hypothetical protein